MPTSRMWPPTHSIAAVPTTPSTLSTIGMAFTRPWPSLRVFSRVESLRPTSSIFTMPATTP